MTLDFEGTSNQMFYHPNPESMKKIYKVLESHLDIIMKEKQPDFKKPKSNFGKPNNEKIVKPITPKQLYKCNKRATQIVVAQGYKGVEKDLQQVLVQTRRRRNW